MTGAPTGPDPVPVPEHENAEVWTYAGIRLDPKQRRSQVWVEPGGEQVWFPPKGRYVVGNDYHVRARRAPDGGLIGMRGTSEFAHRHHDEAVHAELEAQHRAVEHTLATRRLERSQGSALDTAMAPLLSLARRLNPPEREALLAHVIRTLTRLW